MTVRKAMLDFGKNMGMLKGVEALEEGLQQAVQIGVGEMAKAWRGVEEGFSWEDALGEVKDSILTTLWSGIGTSSPTVRFGVDVADARRGGGAAWLHDQRLAAASEQEQAILGDLDTLAQESKLAQRDPILYEDAMRTLAQGGTVNTVYIPATGLAAAYGEDGGQASGEFSG